jgi:site-specific recombinase XerD
MARGLVFVQRDGEQHDPWTLKRQLAAASRKAGLRCIRRHDARHSFASNLVIAGAPLLVVQKWMGHSTIAMTMKYAHLAPNAGAEFIHALDGASSLRSPDAHASEGVG